MTHEQTGLARAYFGTYGHIADLVEIKAIELKRVEFEDKTCNGRIVEAGKEDGVFC